MQIIAYDLKTMKLLVSRTLANNILKVVYSDHDKKPVSVSICDDQRHCIILTEFSIFIIDFIANKLKATYHAPIKMSMVTFTKDLKHLVVVYGNDSDFLILSYDKQNCVLEDV